MPAISARPLPSGSPKRAAGMTLIEILVATLVVLVLMGLLLPAVGVVRRTAQRSEARQTVSELVTVFTAYRQEDVRRRFPPVRADAGIHRDLLDLLDERDLWSRGSRRLDAGGLLLDPWERPYRYRLDRPTPVAGAAAMAGWNWDPEHGRERRWGPLKGPGTGPGTAGALPFPYLWSLGVHGHGDDATEWIFVEDGV